MSREQEKRADMDTELGRFKEFNSVEELIADLHSVNAIYTCPHCGMIYYSNSSAFICSCVGNM